MHKPIQTWLFPFVVILLVLSAGYADEDPRYIKIRDALHKFSYLYPQQKVFLHVDKQIYRGGDMLWIKAYLVNAMDHLPDTMSTNLYVEVISPSHSRVEIKRLQLFNGFAAGDFRLSDTLPEGLYQIRAFTSWMQNFNTEYYFEKNFQVINPSYRKLISPKQARLNVKEMEDQDKLTEDIDVQFMPEGGYLVNGLESVVAVKAINKLGKGVDVSGSVFDDKGNKVTGFSTAFKGIGTFSFKPEADRKYYALMASGNREYKTELPEALETGLVMHVENNEDKVIVHYTSNRPSTNDPTANEVITVAQVGGRIYFSRIVRLENNKAMVSMPQSIFPGGTMQITAFSGRGIPLAERLVFMSQHGIMNIKFLAFDSVAPDDSKKIAFSILVKGQHDEPLQANFSLSVTRELSEPSDVNRDNIVSNLLLLSDLSGYIEDPLDYFQLPRQEAIKALDGLMLTQGWRRFAWKSILAGEYPRIRYLEEKGITISGKITREFFSIPMQNCRVELSIMDEYNDVFTQYTTNKGLFLFENLVYYDTVSVKIEAWRPSGRRNVQILLPTGKVDDVLSHQGAYSLTTLSERDKKAYRMVEHEEYKKLYEEEQKALAEKRKNSIEGLYGDPDYVLYYEDFGMVTGNILDVIKGRVPGVMVNGDNVVIRGINTIYGSTEPLYLLDGIQVSNVGVITAIPLEDIERVEILKGPKTSFYGSRGANGVIAVYTKRGNFMVRGKLEFDMLGYSMPREFYQPRYTPENEPVTNYTLLWKSVIVTDSTGKATVVFDKPEITGNYRFDLQGMSYGGHVGYAEEVIFNQ